MPEKDLAAVGLRSYGEPDRRRSAPARVNICGEQPLLVFLEQAGRVLHLQEPYRPSQR